MPPVPPHAPAPPPPPLYPQSDTSESSDEGFDRSFNSDSPPLGIHFDFGSSPLGTAVNMFPDYEYATVPKVTEVEAVWTLLLCVINIM
jgi:hypothetical protein